MLTETFLEEMLVELQEQQTALFSLRAQAEILDMEIDNVWQSHRRACKKINGLMQSLQNTSTNPQEQNPEPLPSTVK